MESPMWLVDLERLRQEAPERDGFLTMVELRERLHKSSESLRDMLRRAQQLDRLETKRVQVSRIDGGTQMVPAYRVKAPKAKQR